jgi:hypothetical protein
MTAKFDPTYVAKVILQLYDDGADKCSALAAVVRSIADELSYYEFLPNNDHRVIDADTVYKVAQEIEKYESL